MKLLTLLLVLSLVVLMVEPGDAILHHIYRGFVNAGRSLHRFLMGHGTAQLDDQDFDQDTILIE